MRKQSKRRAAEAKGRPRRPKGSGTAYFFELRQLWVCAAELARGSDGKRRRRLVYGKTKVEAEAKLADLKARQGGSLQPVNQARVADYMAPWLTSVSKRVRPKTAASYDWAWSHAKPLIGGVRLDRFDRATVLELFAELSRAGASANTIRHVSRVMQTALQDAIADGAYSGLNPFSLVQKQKPKHKTERGRALSVAECLRFIEAARADRLEAAWLLGLTAGLRIGEMFGLQWADVDFAGKTIFVQRQALFVDGKLLIDELKTADSLRLLAIEEPALSALERRKAAADNEKPSSWVFPSANPKNPMNPNNARRRNFADVCAAAKIEGNLTPHDLRHSMNSLANAVGVSEKDRSERLGHADSKITRTTYTHTIDGQARDAAKKIGELLRSS